jgi:Predicted esterase
MLDLSGPIIEPKQGDPRQLVVLLHGYGADGNNLIPLGEIWQESLPQAVFVAPNAPTPCEGMPFGYQWCSMQDWTIEILKDRLFEAAPLISKYIKNLMAHYAIADATQVALVGFSQGAMMALYQAVYGLEQCAGVVGFSGGFVADTRLKPKGLPKALLIHGEQDDVVASQMSIRASQELQTLGASVDLMLEPDLTHEISPEGLARAQQFLIEIFKD